MKTTTPLPGDSMQESSRYVSDSLASQSQVVMPPHLNGYGNLFGGQLAVWIDIIAGIVARRHCGMKITTAAIDNLRFRKSVVQNDIVVLRGRMTYVGVTSMEVRVDSYLENDDCDRELINTAFVIQVALDENDKPCRVPRLIPQTPEEEKDFAAGAKRKELRTRVMADLYD